MKRLRYTRYVAQGGDWGTVISAAMVRQAPEGLLGIHVSFPQMVPPGVLGRIRNGDAAPADLSDAERRAYEQVAFATYHRGYGVIQGTRPQTIGYSLADTPVGLAVCARVSREQRSPVERSSFGRAEECVHQSCGVETPDFRPGRKRRSPLPRVTLIRNGAIGQAWLW